MNVLGLHSFQKRVSPFWRNRFFVKRFNIDLLRTGRSASILHSSRVIPDNGSHRSLKNWIWTWLDRLETSRYNCPTSGRWAYFSFPLVFQGDLWRRSRWHEDFCVFDFYSFHRNNFRNTISWKCFWKDDCIRSSLVWNVNPFSTEDWCRPKKPRLDVFSMLCAGIVHDAGTLQVNLVRILVTFCPLDQQAERVLSVFCSNFDLQVLIPNWWENVKWKHIRHGRCTGRSCSE